jgi:hypothetical protein
MPIEAQAVSNGASVAVSSPIGCGDVSANYAMGRFAPVMGTIETRIVVANSVFRELLNFISNSSLSAVGMASAASSNGQFMRFCLSYGSSAQMRRQTHCG